MTKNRWLYIVAGIAVGWGISTAADKIPSAFGHEGPSQAQYNACLKMNRQHTRRIRQMVPRATHEKLLKACTALRQRARGMVSKTKYDNLKKLFQVTMKNVNKKMDTMRKDHRQALFRKDQALKRARHESQEKSKQIRSSNARHQRTVDYWKRQLDKCTRASSRR